MLARFGAALAFAGTGFSFADGVALFAVTVSDAAAVVAVAKMRQLDPTHGNADQVLSLFADQLTFGEKLPQIVANAALDDLAKTLVVFFDLEDHKRLFLDLWREFHSHFSGGPQGRAASANQRIQ